MTVRRRCRHAALVRSSSEARDGVTLVVQASVTRLRNPSVALWVRRAAHALRQRLAHIHHCPTYTRDTAVMVHRSWRCTRRLGPPIALQSFLIPQRGSRLPGAHTRSSPMQPSRHLPSYLASCVRREQPRSPSPPQAPSACNHPPAHPVTRSAYIARRLPSRACAAGRHAGSRRCERRWRPALPSVLLPSARVGWPPRSLSAPFASCGSLGQIGPLHVLHRV